MAPDHPQRDYRGMQVLVMGLGSFGGGTAVVRFLAQREARITVTDTRTSNHLADSLSELSDIPDLRFKLGGHDANDFEQADLIVVNPAIRRDNPYLVLARQTSVPLTSEMNLFWQWNPAPVVAVTGSNGKSTTTALIHSILKHTSKRCWLGGNIGISLLPQLDQIRSDDIVILELSSFQLTDLDRLQVSPNVSVLTNFDANHLDWHDTLDHYRWAKQTMLRWQRSSDIAILNSDDRDVREWPTRGKRFEFALNDTGHDGVFDSGDAIHARFEERVQSLPIRQWLRLPGRHNLVNALAATCAALQLGADARSIELGLTNYQPLPHRLEWIADVGGRRYYNDSLATTPESAIVAIEAFESPIILLAGGYDKHVDLGRMASMIAKRVKAVALMGQTAESLRRLIQVDPHSQCQTSPELRSFREAMVWAVAQSNPGDVILLSPGCASYDWFRNYADRGQQFIEFVRSIVR